jgi:hypothetical protein
LKMEATCSSKTVQVSPNYSALKPRRLCIWLVQDNTAHYWVFAIEVMYLQVPQKAVNFLNSTVTILRTMDHGLQLTMAWYVISVKVDIPKNPIKDNLKMLM